MAPTARYRYAGRRARIGRRCRGRCQRMPRIIKFRDIAEDERRLPRRLLLGPDGKSRASRVGSNLLSQRLSTQSSRILTVESNADVRKILFEGREATGVSVVVAGEERTILGREIIRRRERSSRQNCYCSRESVRQTKLRALGLKMVADLPGVGRNLQNHAIVHIGRESCAVGAAGRKTSPARNKLLPLSSGHPDGMTTDMYMIFTRNRRGARSEKQLRIFSPSYCFEFVDLRLAYPTDGTCPDRRIQPYGGSKATSSVWPVVFPRGSGVKLWGN